MANASVIDELIVRLRLDAEQYDKVEKTVEAKAERTAKKQQARETKAKRADQDKEKRMKSLASTAKTFATQLGALALVSGAVATAIGGTLANLTGFELGLRRQAVSTGLSNRQMQAWGSTARRLGADADAGAQAIAALAKEQKQFRITGNAPTLQALARAGVNVSPNASIPDMLASAQGVYRNASPAQQQQMEATLSAQGVSPDLILMITSTTDALKAYNKSLTEATPENRKGLDAVADAMASLKANTISAANALLTVLQPGIEVAATWFGKAAKATNEFADKVTTAGGGLAGLEKVLDTEAPALGTALRALANVVDVVRFGLHELAGLLPSGGFADRVNAKIRSEVAKPNHNPLYGILNSMQNVGRAIKGTAGGVWDSAVGNAHGAGYNMSAPSAGVPRGTAVGAQALMSTLITQHGLSVGEAAAVVANWQHESALKPNSVNPAGGGQGALGLANWRGSRIDAFRARYGVTPDQATAQQQVDFMFSDPYERSLLNKTFAKGGSARTLGENYSKIYEGYGELSEVNRRGQLAAQLAAQYRAGNPNAPAGTAAINIQTVNVQANNAQEFTSSIQRATDVQNYNSAVQ